MRLTATTTGLALALSLSLIRPAHADETPKPTPMPTTEATPERQALALFKESEKAYADARFTESLRLLREAYALHPVPVLLYNMARVHETMGELDSAIEVYERYLAEAPAIPDRPALEARVASLKRLRDEKKAKAPPAREPTVVPWIVAGAGGLVLAGAGVFGLLSKSRDSDAISEPIQRTAAEARDDAATYATIANVGFVVGGAIVLGGLVWGLVTVSSRPAQSASGGRGLDVAVTPAGVVGHF